jgi:hypothetical protein
MTLSNAVKVYNREIANDYSGKKIGLTQMLPL